MKIVRWSLLALCLVGCGVAPTPTPSDPLPAEPPDFPGSAGALPWRDDVVVPSELREGHAAFADLEATLRQITGYLSSTGGRGMQVAVGLLAPLSDDEAHAYGFVSGVPDDSVAGDEYRFTLRRSGDGWFVAELQQRTHCRRGVSDGLCV